ncbi:hypothetical protein BH10BDE1_BH10BDE1_34810 [soil metagenome]
MKTQSVKMLLTLVGLSLVTGCTPVEFKQMASESIATSITPDPDVIIPPPVVPPPVVVVPPPVVPPPVVVVPPAPSMSKGACAADSSTKLLSCMNCLVPATPQDPQFSKKGKAFLDIMTMGCQVLNKSDPAGYVPPTRAELLRRLNRLSPTIYPDTPMTEIQVSTINDLLTSAAAEKDMWGWLWQSGVKPTTTAFETYFGLETVEARYTFCYASASNGTPEGTSATFGRNSWGPVHSKAWFDCQYGNDPYNCKENAAYQAANVYRDQLRKGMNESINNPYVAPNPTLGKSCEWEKFDGLNDSRADAQITMWLINGFTVAGEVTSAIASENMCAPIKGPVSGVTGKISLAAYRCK